MIVKERQETPISPIMKYFDLSDEEKIRLKEICDELKSIYNADSVDIVVFKPPLSPKCDYEIRIHNGDAIGYIFDGENIIYGKEYLKMLDKYKKEI